MRIAHISDLHVLASAGVELRRILFDKRVTGYANLLLKRGRVYRQDYLRAVVDAVRHVDQVVVTGDITNLSLEGEYEAARALLDDLARSVEVTVIPGNHDIYLPVVLSERRFPHHFRTFFQSDLPELALDLAAGNFPAVKLRGPAAIIALSSAVPRPPFVSAGFIGQAQLDALARILAHPEVQRRTPVVLVHHDPIDDRFRLEQLKSGLVDAANLRQVLAPLRHGLVLFGHLHVRRHDRLTTLGGALDVVCSTAAPLDHPSPEVRAGYNLYELAEDGRILSVETAVWDPGSSRFDIRELPITRIVS